MDTQPGEAFEPLQPMAASCPTREAANLDGDFSERVIGILAKRSNKRNPIFTFLMADYSVMDKREDECTEATLSWEGKLNHPYFWNENGEQCEDPRGALG
jgi:hypothetical protein